jgi:hypothetical protein
MEYELSNEQKDIAKAAREFAGKEFTQTAEALDRDEIYI